MKTKDDILLEQAYTKILLKENWEDPADFENSPLPHLKAILSHLRWVQDLEAKGDYKNFKKQLRKINLKVLWTGSDDNQDEEIDNCANVTIKGIRFAFWWVDDLSFLYNYQKDDQAFADLISTVEGVIAQEEHK